MTRAGVTLTGRGVTMLVAAGLFGIGGYVSGVTGGVYVAVFLATAVAVGTVASWLSAPRLTLTRRVGLPMVAVGARHMVRFEISHLRRGRPAHLLAQDLVPIELGEPARFALTAGGGTWTRHLTYEITPTRRGRYVIGPLRLHATDPFGIAVTERVLGETSEVLVPPRVWELTSQNRSGVDGLTARTAPFTTPHGDDAMVRDYRAGDDVRRIHWRSTARTGALMVRHSQPESALSVTVLLDNRQIRPSTPAAEEAFEWIVEVATSIAVHCAANRYHLSTVTPDETLVRPSEVPSPASILAAHAELTPTHADSISSDPVHPPSPGLLVVITRRLSPSDADSLLDMSGPHSRAVIVCADDAQDAVATNLLIQSGWLVISANPGADVDGVWRQILEV